MLSSPFVPAITLYTEILATRAYSTTLVCYLPYGFGRYAAKVASQVLLFLVLSGFWPASVTDVGKPHSKHRYEEQRYRNYYSKNNVPFHRPSSSDPRVYALSRLIYQTRPDMTPVFILGADSTRQALWLIVPAKQMAVLIIFHDTKDGH